MQYILWAILLYFLYIFLVRLVIPIFRTTRRIKQKMQEMKSRQSDYAHDRREATPKTPVQEEPPSYADKGEYIDFEEIKK